MKMDEKWIPAMPVPGWKSWTSRGKELSGFKDWLEKFSGWLSLIHDAYGPELWETIHADYSIQPCRTPEQVMRSKRLFHILQQQFVGYSKIENLIRSRISATGITESNGFELLRLIRKEFSLMSRTEALSYREMCLKFRVKRTEHLLDIIREVESEIESFQAMLDVSVCTYWVMLGSVKETSFCCIFEICQIKSRSFSRYIETLWRYNSWRPESRTITSELEFKVI